MVNYCRKSIILDYLSPRLLSKFAYRRARRRILRVSEAFYTRLPIFPIVPRYRCINITLSLYTSVRGYSPSVTNAYCIPRSFHDCYEWEAFVASWNGLDHTRKYDSISKTPPMRANIEFRDPRDPRFTTEYLTVCRKSWKETREIVNQSCRKSNSEFPRRSINPANQILSSSFPLPPNSSNE